MFHIVPIFTFKAIISRYWSDIIVALLGKVTFKSNDYNIALLPNNVTYYVT